jgi:hypothetical protein
MHRGKRHLYSMVRIDEVTRFFPREYIEMGQGGSALPVPALPYTTIEQPSR